MRRAPCRRCYTVSFYDEDDVRSQGPPFSCVLFRPFCAKGLLHTRFRDIHRMRTRHVFVCLPAHTWLHGGPICWGSVRKESVSVCELPPPWRSEKGASFAIFKETQHGTLLGQTHAPSRATRGVCYTLHSFVLLPLSCTVNPVIVCVPWTLEPPLRENRRLVRLRRQRRDCRRAAQHRVSLEPTSLPSRVRLRWQ